jgi:tetratricopeptide (TPR) repeat protein
MTTRVVFVSALSVLLIAGTARADSCPDEVPEDGVARRAQAKRWFAQGQTAADAGDDLGAIKAYQCSLKFVAHGFTAYNLAQIAERVGDLDAAVRNYEQYLQLVPDAKDGQDVRDRVSAIRKRLEKARQEAENLPLFGPPVASSASAAVEPPAQPQPARKSSPPEAASESVTATSPAANSYRTAAWILYGGAGAALVGGLVTNLLARSKMDTCRTTYVDSGRSAAESACSDAKPLAYVSYALFGVSAAAAVVGTVLVLHPTESSEVALNVLPQGGLVFGWSGAY